MSEHINPVPPDGDWPELVSFESPDLPRLRADLLPSWAGDFARALAESTATPPEMAITLVLAACSVAAARRLRVGVKPGLIEPCNLWGVVAMPPGSRKSAVQSATTEPLSEFQHDKAEQMRIETRRAASERATQEARAKELRSQSAKEKDPTKSRALADEVARIEAELIDVPTPPQIWTSEATPEQLGVMLAENCERMAWLSTEGGIFDLLQGRYSGGIPNLDLMLKAHSGDPDRIDRRSRGPVELRNPLLTIGLTVQPDVLRGLAGKPGFRGRGLLARFIYVIPPSNVGFRPVDTVPVSEAVAKAYGAGLLAMLEWQSATDTNGKECMHTLTLTDEALAAWRAFHEWCEAAMRPGGELEHMADWASKCHGLAARIAGVLHGIKHAMGSPWLHPIAVDTMEAALELTAVYARHSRAALDMMGMDETIEAARRVWHWISRGRRSRFTVREAYQALKGTFPRVEPLRAALEALQERGYVRVIEAEPTGPGRPPSPLVMIRPDIAASWV